MQRTKIESKSQPVVAVVPVVAGCYQICKELKLKANHNRYSRIITGLMLLSNMQRTKIESKSQLIEDGSCAIIVVIKYAKN